MIGAAIGALGAIGAVKAASVAKKKTSTKSSSSAINAKKLNEHEQYIQDTHAGGYDDYKRLQQERYNTAYKTGDYDLMQRLDQDALRVGYNLAVPNVNNNSKKNTSVGSGYDYTKMSTQDTPKLNLPEYEKFKYDDFNYGKEFTYDDFNYKDFNYDAKTDPSYQQYADMYARQGQSASESALANASSATGGMPSSYAAAANAQAQQAYAKKTADMIPVLEGQAYDRYSNDRNFSYQDYLNDRSLEYDKFYNDKNFTYQDYLNNRNLAYTEHQSKYGYDRDNALSQYNADWQNVNYADARNDLAYDRQYQQDVFDYQKFLDERNRGDMLIQRDIDNTYRQDTFDWNKSTDDRNYNRDVLESDRNYNYNAGQDAIRNSISWANQGLSRDRFEYDKMQDELTRQERKKTAQDERRSKDFEINYPNTVIGQLEQRTAEAKEAERQNNIRAAVSSALQAPNAAEWLRENAAYLSDDEYASVIKILKDYGTISKQQGE